MIPWIQVYSNLPQHRKTSSLAEELKLSSAAVDPNMIAVGLLVGLWTWAIQNAYDGDLSKCSARAIANACQWKKKPEVLVAALIKTGWLDEDMRLHDWDDYSVMYQELQDDSKIKHRERQRRYRERKKAGVTVTSPGDDCDAVPNLTRPNQTRPLFSGGGGDAGARAQEGVSDFCAGRNSDPDEYFGMTPEIRTEVAAVTDAIFARFTTRTATEHDRSQVFLALYENRRDERTGLWTMTLPEENKRLLMYAFEAAANAGKAGDWRYISGVLAKLRQRNISTLDQAEDYDDDRSAERL